MLRLLRKKAKKQVKKTQKGVSRKIVNKDLNSTFWLYSISEFIIVILGILIALQIDNWNNNRLDRQFEEALLIQFKENLTVDLKDIEYNINYLEDILSSNSIINQFLTLEIEYNDTLNKHFGNLANGVIFLSDISTYENAKSVGMTIIRNDELRRKISYLYSGRYHYIHQISDAKGNHITNFLQPFMFEYLKDYKAFSTATPKDIERITEASEFHSSVQIHITTLEYLIFAFKHARDDIFEIRDLINEELRLE